ncbi:MAG: aldehyde dehydrogenase family protein [Chloroflexi bacterium HGW-Chloroflexi-10]|nr:MAG: aldehyde dehydrogenase family protein [Chloroflexi bacterium HGW-Chloroflexi-10]
MQQSDIVSLMKEQTSFFRSGKTLEIDFRKEMLRRLLERIREFTPQLLQALKDDLAKSETEAYGGEIGFVIEEIEYTLRHLPGWTSPQRIRTPLLHFWGSSRIYSEPYGRVLIIAPWNYPFQLLFSPLVGALAAGNCIILKPSELAPHTAAVMEELVNAWFDPGLVCVVNGGAETAKALLAEAFDKIFFTGSPRVGKLVMQAAAEHLTPVTLELGGKSPAIVEASADLPVAARRILWGKFFNAGQTCVAPDYVLVQNSVKGRFLALMQETLRLFYGDNPQSSPDYARMINDIHFQRLVGLIDPDKVYYGGQADAAERYIAPTLLENVTLEDAVMGEEIFGPILPVLGFDTLEEAMAIIAQRPNPLALYLFTRDQQVEKRVLREVPFGGGCINDTLSQVFNEEMPFGGRGSSGMGAYHGHYSFEAFSHAKGVVRRANWPDIPIRYAPYRISLPWLKRLLKYSSRLW